MNRAARRQAGVTKKAPTYNINQQQLQDLIEANIVDRVEEVKQVSISHTSKALSAAFVIGLHDHFGFGPKRLQRVLEKVQLQFECIEAGTVTLDELIQWCLDYGIDIK